MPIPRSLISALALLSASLATAGTLEISRLRCEYLVEPRGLTEARPRLSWELGSDRRGARQLAWQVRVASTPAQFESPDLWDSGRVEGDASAQVAYDGKPLGSNQEAHWQVRVWDEGGQPSPWSSPACWSMGLLDPKDWKAAWIGLPAPAPEAGDFPAAAQWAAPAGTPPLEAPAGTTRYRYRFDVGPAAPPAVALRLAADDRCRAWLNDRHILTAAGFDHGQQLEITDFLEPGTNTLAIEVTNDAQGPSAVLCQLACSTPGATFAPPPFHTAAKATADAPAGWENTQFDDAAWPPVTAVAPAGAAPWGPVRWTDVSQALPARMLRHEFQAGPVRRAVVHLTGLGYHELHLNGRKVGDRALEPALTDYDRRVPVSTHDVTALLKPGRNAIGLWLGNGRYHAPDLHVPTPTRSFGAPLARLQLHLELADGTRQTVVTDPASWRATDAGPIRANNDYDGETWDARLDQPGWSEAGFDDSRWQPAAAMPAPKGAPAHVACPPIRVTERLKPKKITQPRPGTFIADFGQNLVGWCHLQAAGPRDTTIRLRHAETLRPDGTLFLANLRGAAVTDRFTLAGTGASESFEPRFTYHGFRYVELTGLPGEPGPDTLEACVAHSDLEPAGTWKSSNELLDRILANVRRGLRGNYLSIPTDCPQRDERQGWQGDRAAESRGEAYLFDTAAFYSKWLADIRDSQQPDGNVSDVCPAYWPFYTGSAVWPAVQTIVPQTLYQIYADRRATEQAYPGVARWLRFQLARRQPDGLLPPDPYGDWCPPPRDPAQIHATAPDVVTDKRFVANCYLAGQLGLAAEMARLSGHPADADAWLAARTGLAAAIQSAWWAPETSTFANGTQSSSVLPLAFELVPADGRPALARSLVARIRTNDRSHIGTGLIGAQWLFRTLTDIGHAGVAFEIATQRTYPSLGYMVDHDATTIWELWNGDTADPAMNSHNHVMLVGDLVSWCFERLAGIRPETPGFARLLMRPEPVGDLAFVEAEYRSIRGPVRSHWQRRPDGAFEWDIHLPANTAATVVLPLPDQPNPNVTESGKPLAEVPAVRPLPDRSPPGHLAVEIPAGRYHFEVR